MSPHKVSSQVVSPQVVSSQVVSSQVVSPQVVWDFYETLFVHCPTCARECLAEAPPCPDGHADCCPELACLECGTALLDAPIVQFVRASDVASSPRHAA